MSDYEKSSAVTYAFYFINRQSIHKTNCMQKIKNILMREVFPTIALNKTYSICLFVVCWFFYKSAFQKNIQETIRVSNVLSPVLILAQTVCKGYQRTTKLFAIWVFFRAYFSSQKSAFLKKKIFRVSSGSEPNQDRRFVGPDLGPNCMQRLSADDKSRCYQGKFWHLLTDVRGGFNM